MKHFQLPESNKSMIPLVECIFLSAAMPGLVYIVVWAIQIPNKNAANKQQPRVSKQRVVPKVVLLYAFLWPEKQKCSQPFESLPLQLSKKANLSNLQRNAYKEIVTSLDKRLSNTSKC